MPLANSLDSLRFPPARTAAGPGGLPRHFRVQVFDSRHLTWKLHGVYTNRRAAEQTIQVLEGAKTPCRLVECRHCAMAV